MSHTTANKQPPSPTKGKYSKVDEYGFRRNDDFDYKSYENFMSEYNAVLVRRAQRWKANKAFKSKFTLTSTEKRFIRKGIPTEYRQKIWMQTSGAFKQMKKHPNLYQETLKKIDPNGEDKDLVDQIKTDLDRTYPDNINFENSGAQKMPLFNVLCASGKHNSTIGYCQGINYIAGLLLIVVGDEEQAFWLLEALLSHILPKYYSQSLFEMRVDIEVLERLVKQHHPRVANKLYMNDINFTLVSSKWFICIFADVLPTETVLRVWDCLFMEGSKIIFRVAMLLVDILEDDVCKANDLMELTQVFKSVTTAHEVVECHAFMREMFSRTNYLRRAELKQMRVEAAVELQKQEK